MSSTTTAAASTPSPTDAYVIAGTSIALLVLFVIFLIFVFVLCRQGCGCCGCLHKKTPQVDSKQVAPTERVHEYAELGVGRRRHKYDYPKEPVQGMCRPYVDLDIGMDSDIKSAFSASQRMLCTVSSRDDLTVDDDADADADDTEDAETEVMALPKGVSVRIKDGRFHKIVDIQFE
ncbi:uncharacterized protein LOC124114946 [Haliotis rufescens]|uniref:uncharacterized protein LOC124114946 n=1 Tax=Haliotis rufescens TaxID=6454 RepID=UPI00201F0CAD|nr:uncharacterized protein LOC124114946 [Haliotis rufescens]